MKAPTIAAAAGALLLAACGVNPPMSDADTTFDEAMSEALLRHEPIVLSDVEKGPWTEVCAVGEGRTSSMMPGAKARLDEEALDTFIDAGSNCRGCPGNGALAFRYPDGVEVRPLTGLSINMGSAINICVARERAVLMPDFGNAWRFARGPTPKYGTPSSPWVIDKESETGVIFRALSDDLGLKHRPIVHYPYYGEPLEQKYVTVGVLNPTFEKDSAFRDLPQARIAQLIAEGNWREAPKAWVSTDFPMEVYAGGAMLYYLTPDRRLQCRDTTSATGEDWPNPFIQCTYRHPAGELLSFTVPLGGKDRLPWLTPRILKAVDEIYSPIR